MIAFLPSQRLGVPLKPRSKHIQPGYGSHKTHISDPAFARKWFLNTDANLAVFLGGTTGLLVVDWDDAQSYHLWRSSIGASTVTLTEQTARGYHAFFFASNLPSAANQNCEVIASGVCMVTPSIHPSGLVYRITHHDPMPLALPWTKCALLESLFILSAHPPLLLSVLFTMSTHPVCGSTLILVSGAAIVPIVLPSALTM